MRFFCEILLSPGDLAVNRAWRTRKNGGMVKSALYRVSRKLAAAELRAAAEDHEWPVHHFAGEVSVRITAYWPGQRGDVDAPVKGILDALQHAGVVMDDRQVCSVSCTRYCDLKNPRMIVHVAE